MSWRAITENDLLQRMSGDELTALRDAALGDDQADPIAGHISQITDFVRGYIAAWQNNTLGLAGTLPERLILTACDILVVQVSSRPGGFLVDLNDTRKEQYKSAMRLLEQVAAGKFRIEEPATEGDDSPTPPSPSMYDRDRYFTSSNQDGI